MVVAVVVAAAAAVAVVEIILVAVAAVAVVVETIKSWVLFVFPSPDIKPLHPQLMRARGLGHIQYARCGLL